MYFWNRWFTFNVWSHQLILNIFTTYNIQRKTYNVIHTTYNIQQRLTFPLSGVPYGECDCARRRRSGQLTILLILALLQSVCHLVQANNTRMFFVNTFESTTFYFISPGNNWIQMGFLNIHKHHLHKKPSLLFINIPASEKEKNIPCRSSSVQPSQIMRTSYQPSPLFSPTKRWLFVFSREIALKRS